MPKATTTTSIIGRARTVLTFGPRGATKAAVATVTAAAGRATRGKRLVLTGPVAFDPATTDHLAQTVLASLDRVIEQLSPPGSKRASSATRRRFELSAVNLAPASLADVGLNITGFSADVAVFLALLSAALKMPVPQNIVSTGHIASADGEIRLVGSIPSKIAAAVEDPTVSSFIYPGLDVDASLGTLAPNARTRAHDAVAEAAARIRTIPVVDVRQLVEAVFSDEAIVSAALAGGFFDGGGPRDRAGENAPPAARAGAFLAEGNNERFWRVLADHLAIGDGKAAGAILRARARYQIRQKRYPSRFGRRLLGLLQSLPKTARRAVTNSPLLAQDRCLRLGQLASSHDAQDVRYLLDAAMGRNVWPTDPVDPPARSTGPGSLAGAVAEVDAVLAEINAHTLAEKIGRPIDAARAAFVLNGVLVDSDEEFCDVISSFYMALLRCTDQEPAAEAGEAIADEAHDLLVQSFRDHGGPSAAQAEGRDGVRGGMRFVLDIMTEQYKTQRRARHVSRILKEGLDPLDWAGKVEFMRALLDRMGPEIAAVVQTQPPEQFVHHYEDIVRTYVQSLDRVRDLLRTF